MREQSVENYLRDEVKAVGGRCVKLVPLGWVGIPDRLAVLPAKGLVAFIEVKKPRGGRYSAMQIRWRDWLEAAGHWVLGIHTRRQVDEFIAEARNRMGDREG